MTSMNQINMTKSKNEQEQSFNILPHPAKSNNPADLTSEPAEHGGLQSASYNAYNAKGPHIPSHEIQQGLEKPKTRDELKAEAEKLNS